MRHRFSCAVVVMAGACAAEPAEVAPVEATGATQALIVPPGGPCPRFGCGANSPVIDTLEIHELSLRPGERNLQGFAIATANRAPLLVQGGRSYALRVEDGVISGVAAKAGVLEHEGLIGAVIPVVRGKQRFELSILGVREMQYFVAPFDRVEAYTLGWREVGTDRPAVNLCNDQSELERQLESDPEGAQRELMGMAVAEAIVFEGDRVDADGKTMSKDFDDRWFNFGCAGHALAKLRLTHNTVHSQDPQLARPWEQRQATLKMLAADYCGTGDPFTVAGQPLVWQGANVGFWAPPRLLEARWTEAGATCVDAPRLLFPTALGAKTFPDIWDAIRTVCKPDKCAAPDPHDFDGADRVSANP